MQNTVTKVGTERLTVVSWSETGSISSGCSRWCLRHILGLVLKHFATSLQMVTSSVRLRRDAQHGNFIRFVSERPGLAIVLFCPKYIGFGALCLFSGS